MYVVLNYLKTGWVIITQFDRLYFDLWLKVNNDQWDQQLSNCDENMNADCRLNEWG